MRLCDWLMRSTPLWVAFVVGLLAVASNSASAQQSAATADTQVEESELADLASRSLLLDVVQNANRVIAVGDRGHVLLSDDPASNSWKQVVVPTRSMLTAIASGGDGQFWAVGHDAVILKSTDSGQSWQLQSRDAELEAPLLDVWFEEGNHGFAVGAYGLFYETSDGGQNWEQRSIDEEEPHFYTLFESANGSLLLAGEFGSILRSPDRGETWVRLESPYEGSFFGGLGLSDGTLLLFGLRGNLFRSTDNGETWIKIDTGVTASLLGATEQSDGQVVIVGLSGTLLRSNDGGQSFTLTGGLRREGLNAVLPSDGGGLLLVGERGVSLLTDATAGAVQ
ncbi:YCF48-related protein [Pelagibius sp. Alg239-R121]|uniref:WD40/YVTN/BNR-like repeat-containing protein n=1 Tax=Pelagibius sp. Alg239-R121 TaxID=2993448 RepID=UPI0024A6C4F5|nr:YCF48-related protein [Pelagibius sp. Alg239-R121]